MSIIDDIKAVPDRPHLCSEDVYDATTLYWNLVIGALIAAIVMVLTYICFLRRRLEGAPALAAQFFFVTGSVMVFVGLALVVVFQPDCPADCDPALCAELREIMPGSFFGLFIITAGFIWMYFGKAYMQRAEELAGNGERGDLVYGEVSQIECTALDSASSSDDVREGDDEYHDEDDGNAYDDGYECEDKDNKHTKQFS